MTPRRSRREIERAVEDLGDDSDGEDPLLTVYHDPSRGDYYDLDREPVDADAVENHSGRLVKITLGGVVPREQAEREGRTIIGPADDVPADGHVVVRPEWMK